MKILQICNFSSGISGVWTRVLEDAREFIKRGYDVHIFSSNETENGEIIEKSEETLEGIEIKRFPIKRRRGYALWFDFKEEALKLKPEIIICHGLRKPYLGPAIKIAKKINAKCFCITHAPFIEKELRSKKLNFLIWFYDKFIGKRIMNSFDKIIAICKWEKETLLELGCDEKRIEYIPNSLPTEFFSQEKAEEKNKVLFLGRMHPVKKLEILIEAFKKSKLKDYSLEIVSSKSGEYYQNLVTSVEKNGENIIFTEPIYDLTKKIGKIDSSKIFVLPSAKESLPFGLIEAMTRGKIIIATRTKGAEELIEDRKNGFLFEIGNSSELQLILRAVERMSEEGKNKIRHKAMKTAEEFNVENTMKNWEELFRK